jgi:hypothetical protein
MKLTNSRYEVYRSRSPFLIPLPPWVNRIISWPARKIAGGTYPSRPSHVWWIVLLYTTVLISLSLIWVDLRPGRPVDTSDPQALQELSQVVQELDGVSDNRREIHATMKKIPLYGSAGSETLMDMALHPNPIIREFSIQFLAEQQYDAAADIYLGALNDSVKRVRSSAILATGTLSSERAADSLIRLLVVPEYPNNKFHIYGALAEIGQPKAIPSLVKGLDDPEWFNQQAALNAIIQIDPERGIEYAIQELQDDDVHVRQNAVTQCILSEDPRVVQPLRGLFEDEDFEVRFYARQGVRRITR